MTLASVQLVDSAEADLHVRLYIERHVESYVVHRHLRRDAVAATQTAYSIRSEGTGALSTI